MILCHCDFHCMTNRVTHVGLCEGVNLGLEHDHQRAHSTSSHFTRGANIIIVGLHKINLNERAGGGDEGHLKGVRIRVTC